MLARLKGEGFEDGHARDAVGEADHGQEFGINPLPDRANVHVPVPGEGGDRDMRSWVIGEVSDFVTHM